MEEGDGAEEVRSGNDGHIAGPKPGLVETLARWTLPICDDRTKVYRNKVHNINQHSQGVGAVQSLNYG